MYTLLDLTPAEHGETIRVAVCKSFKQVAQAQRDGCDVALVRNWRTRFWVKCFEAAHWLQDRLPEKQVAVSDKNIRAFVMHSLERSLQRAGYQVTSFRRKDLNSVRKIEWDGNPPIHADWVDNDETVGVLSTEPTTFICTQRPDVDRGFNPCFARPDGYLEPLSECTHKDTQGFSPVKGTLVMMFCMVAERYNCAHSSPAYDVADIPKRALLAFYMKYAAA